jgi:hypothetical protein
MGRRSMSDHYADQREEFDRKVVPIKCTKSEAVSAMLQASGTLLQARDAIHAIKGITYHTKCVADMIGTFGRTIGDWVDEIEGSYND